MPSKNAEQKRAGKSGSFPSGAQVSMGALFCRAEIPTLSDYLYVLAGTMAA
jgi:hypothetical protein